MMKRNSLILILSAFLFIPSVHLWSKEEKAINQNLAIELDHSSICFGADFYVLYRPDNPLLDIRELPECHYFAPTWTVQAEDAEDCRLTKDVATGGDGFDENLTVAFNNRSYNYFKSAQVTKYTCTGVHEGEDGLWLDYAENSLGNLVVFAQKQGKDKWKMTYSFKADKPGYYSIIYMGAPARKQEQIDFIFQPMVWQQRRFPARSYLSLAFVCSVPASFISSQNQSWAVVVSPEEFPYQPLPTKENNRFGVLTKDDQGNFRPMVAAPVMGGMDSFMKPEEKYTFNFYLYASEEEPTQVYESISTDIYQFHDYRHNEVANLNETIDNVHDYILSEYSCFLDSLKGCSYSTDVLGSVNNSNSLNPISIALLSDNVEMLEKRGIPVTEYMLSRKGQLFCLDTTQKVQHPTRALGGPCATMNELAGLHYFSQSKNSYFLKLIEQKKYRLQGEEWGRYTDLYRATGEKKYLDKAIHGADVYINDTLPALRNKLGLKWGFWNSFNPDFKSLLELYEETGETRFLEAAHQGAREYAMYVWMCPMIPNDKILVNKNGLAPYYWYLQQKGFPQMKANEHYVDAWRLSEVGLLSESSMTNIGHRAVFTAHHAPYMYKIAHYTGDQFLKDIARSAYVGRYRNFPGYHMNTERTDVMQEADYPLHKWNELSVNSLHYNHIMPVLSLLYDCLITDFWHKSQEKISFPSYHTEAHAYLQSNLYGEKPGRFYNYEQVYLWLPKHVLSGVDVELNYLMGIDKDNLYLSFSNQCTHPVACTVSFLYDKIKLDPTKKYEVDIISADGEHQTSVLENGKLSVEVEASGIRSYVIKGVEKEVELLERFFDDSKRWSERGATAGKLSGSHAYVIDFGKGLKDAYVYLEEDDLTIEKVDFEILSNGVKSKYEDLYYPFEYNCAISDDANRVDFRIRIHYRDGKVKSETLRLRK